VSDFLGSAKVPALQALVEQLSLFVQDNWILRKIQAKNTARSAYFFNGTLTGTTVLLFEPAQQSDQVFSYLYLTTDDQSGFGRYRIDGVNPFIGTAAAGTKIGFQVINQGAAILIAGHENIKGFRMVAEFGQTLYYTASLFQ